MTIDFVAETYAVHSLANTEIILNPWGLEQLDAFGDIWKEKDVTPSIKIHFSITCYLDISTRVGAWSLLWIKSVLKSGIIC